ncbi:hypothetical protein EDB82DRAFT_358034 [Fusarium venenatum]|uniref:uncharacterized protein n=1 Tax=Fusarium venenatum TaxID=56646 RepID=UPI001D835200|nr:hypothetical protein EDB82DRAFT_358034 [Fusarium venenatum]
MSSSSASLLSSEAIELYKQDKLFEAEEACEEAVALDLNSSTALNTLLSIDFEGGDNEIAINNTQNAPSMLRAQGIDSQETQLLQRRVAECYLYLSKPGVSKAIAKYVKYNEAGTFLLSVAEGMQVDHEQVDPATQRRLVMDRIPHLRPCLYGC